MIAFSIGVRDTCGLIIGTDHLRHFSIGVDIRIREQAERHREMRAMGPFFFGECLVDKLPG